MKFARRSFFRLLGTTAAGIYLHPGKGMAAAVPHKPPDDPYGCLVDLSVCLGCRKCEQACNQTNKLPAPPEGFDDLRVLHNRRRPDARSYTVVNAYYSGRTDDRLQLMPTFVKTQCMHCQVPACVAACPVGAMTKKPNGAVHYDETKCMGCRYCMIACPFQIPAYEFNNPASPQVRKCTFCFDRISKSGGKPACAEICPVEGIIFGRRSELLRLARQKMVDRPGRYIPSIYGENEVGGTSWLYISQDPFERLGFLPLPARPVPDLVYRTQRTMFRNFIPPAALTALLGGFMFLLGRKAKGGNDEI